MNAKCNEQSKLCGMIYRLGITHDFNKLNKFSSPAFTLFFYIAYASGVEHYSWSSAWGRFRAARTKSVLITYSVILFLQFAGYAKYWIYL